MKKLNEIIALLTSEKYKKITIGVVIALVAILIFTAGKKAGLFGGGKINQAPAEEKVDYIGIKPNEGMVYGRLESSILGYEDKQYGGLEITIRYQVYFRENHEKAYYKSRPYNKTEVLKEIKQIMHEVYIEILQEDQYEYNKLRKTLTSDELVKRAKDQVATLDFTLEQVEVNSIELTQESINKIQQMMNEELDNRTPKLPDKDLDGNNTPTNPEEGQTEGEQNPDSLQPAENLINPTE